MLGAADGAGYGGRGKTGKRRGYGPVEAEAPPKTTRRFTSGWRLSNLYCWLVLIRLRESSKACEMNQEYDRPHLDTSRTCHCVGEREKDTCYPASLFTPRLRTRAWGHFFTQLNPNTNGVDHWETWQHGTRKSERADKQGEIPPPYPIPFLYTYITLQHVSVF